MSGLSKVEMSAFSGGRGQAAGPLEADSCRRPCSSMSAKELIGWTSSGALASERGLGKKVPLG